MPESKQKKKFTIILTWLLAIVLVFHPVMPVFAGFLGGPSVPSASESAAQLEQRYHINPLTVQDQGETLNVADQKKVTPQASIYFSPSDPKEGEVLSARAFPTYFAMDSSKLFYTWYLQRKDCAKGKAPIPQCDLDKNGKLDENDWKIAAHQIIASNNFDYTAPGVYTSGDTDHDGYDARERYGGDTRYKLPNHCYLQDRQSGDIYELVKNANDFSWGCSGGRKPVCMVQSQTLEPGSLTVGTTSSGSSGSATGSGSTFTFGTGESYVSGTPYCPASGTPTCITGTPCCVDNPATARSCEEPLNVCSRVTDGDSNPQCTHLFPDTSSFGFKVGDGDFGLSEEQFWRTNPNDPDTSGNGNKDEANVVGLGQDVFTWNYMIGDKVGVVVEGLSMMPTKHQDSSNMIMWVFTKNNCPASGRTGQYSETVNGYNVIIPTIEMDLNDCLERNLVDPTEGGQATNLELSLTASPDDPVVDVTTRGDGDILEVVSSVDNATKGPQNVYYEWHVEISPDGTSNPVSWLDVTPDLLSTATFSDHRKLLSQTRGNGVSKLQLTLNIQSGDFLQGNPFADYLLNGVGYFRFRLDAAENFDSSGVTRRGRTNLIVKFNASQDRIHAYTINVVGDPARVTLNSDNEICTGRVNSGDPAEYQALQRLDGRLCRVIRNEIIGLEVPTAGDLTNFQWTINGQPLVCSPKVSTVNCPTTEKQGNINFFPIVGSVGDMFNIVVTANKINSTAVPGASLSTEKTVTISKTFKIVQPSVNIVTNDVSSVWPKVLGKYIDTDGSSYTEYSKDTLDTHPGNNVPLRALFTPDFLLNRMPPQVERLWTVDGVGTSDGSANNISFLANKDASAIYNVNLLAVYRPDTLVRKAMQDIWGLSALDTTEVYFSTNTQIAQTDVAGISKKGVAKYYAFLSSYLPGPVLFSLKVMFSVFLILVAASLLFAFIPNVSTTRSSRRSDLL